MATTIDYAPHLTAAILNSIQAKTVPALTVNDLRALLDAINRTPNGSNPNNTVSQILI